MEKKATSFVAACKDFFGFQPGQSLQGFMLEVKALSESDRADIKAGLEQNGYLIQ